MQDLAKVIDHVQEQLARGIRAPRTINRPVPGIGYAESSTAVIHKIAADDRGELMFLNSPRVVEGQNMDLVREFVNPLGDQILALISDGRGWHEFGRSSNSLPVFQPASEYGVRPDTGVDMGPALQFAIDNMPAGFTLYLEPGVYLIATMVTVTRNNFTLWLEPGTILIGQDVIAVINLAGSETGSSVNATANIAARVHATVALTSTTIDTVPLEADEWIVIEDDFEADVTATPRHMEINRVKERIDATHIRLYWPTLDEYTTAETARVRRLNPLINAKVCGGGAITNHGITSTTGGHGLRIDLTVGAVVDDLTISDCRNQCIALTESRKTFINGVEFENAPVFETGPVGSTAGQGYGIATTSAADILIQACKAYRLRHSFDLSYFSRNILVSDCQAFACGFTPYQVHPNVNRAVFDNCMVDGAAGYQNGGNPATVLLDTGGTTAHGFAVREDCNDIHWNGGLIAHTAGSGVSIDNDGCSNITITGTTFYRCNLRGVVNQATIYANDRSNLDQDCPGFTIERCTLLHCYGVGIFTTFNGARIRFNTIIDQRQGNDPDNPFSGGTQVAVGIAIGPRDYAGARILDGVLNDIQTEGNIVVGLSGSLYRGIWFGFDDFVQDVEPANWDVTLTNCRSINDRVTGAIQSGFAAFPSTKTIGGKTARILFGSGCWAEGLIVQGSNLSDTNEDAGILIADVMDVGTASLKFDLFRSRAYECIRNGIIVGFNNQVVEDCHGIDTADGGSAVRNGMSVRSFNVGLDVLDVTLRRCMASGNQIGLLLGSPSGAGMVRRTRVIDCDFNNNEVTGSRENLLCIDTKYTNSHADDNGTYGFSTEGENPKYLRCYASNTSVGGTQDFGIYLSAGIISGSPCVNPTVVGAWCEGNLTANIELLVEGTIHEIIRRQVTVADAAHTLTLDGPEVRYSTLTAARVVTLPPARCVGFEFRVYDGSGACSGVNTLTLTRVGADVFDDGGGATTYVLGTAYAAVTVRCVAAGRWKVV